MTRVKTNSIPALRLCTIVLGIAATAPAFAAVQPQCSVEPASGAPAETRQFAFLIGDHDVSLHAWRNGAWTPPRPVSAKWRGWYGLDGHAVYDEWIDPDTTQVAGGNHGINVRMYDPEEKLWKMMWIATAGRQVQDLRAQVIDGVLTMWQEHPERPGWKAEFRVLDEKRWERIGYQLDAEGVHQPQFRLVATRVRDSVCAQ